MVRYRGVNDDLKPLIIKLPSTSGGELIVVPKPDWDIKAYVEINSKFTDERTGLRVQDGTLMQQSLVEIAVMHPKSKWNLEDFKTGDPLPRTRESIKYILQEEDHAAIAWGCLQSWYPEDYAEMMKVFRTDVEDADRDNPESAEKNADSSPGSPGDTASTPNRQKRSGKSKTNSTNSSTTTSKPQPEENIS